MLCGCEAHSTLALSPFWTIPPGSFAPVCHQMGKLPFRTNQTSVRLSLNKN
eukprot:NODE_1104_length_492_cov_241.353425_g1094_i0.p1 GENE.NODE_1104_length_492_cov_241.353425_g1094_i0~~NODE_1104_length_492_cov_241.353425_g1094_i0.p1  ORF type:complete len:51 (+),score=0.25 NODE_1104_length_492_cov_241.353425_g1094_i0:214-366(+)